MFQSPDWKINISLGNTEIKLASKDDVFEIWANIYPSEAENVAEGIWATVLTNSKSLSIET